MSNARSPKGDFSTTIGMSWLYSFECFIGSNLLLFACIFKELERQLVAQDRLYMYAHELGRSRGEVLHGVLEFRVHCRLFGLELLGTRYRVERELELGAFPGLVLEDRPDALLGLIGVREIVLELHAHAGDVLFELRHDFVELALHEDSRHLEVDFFEKRVDYLPASGIARCA